MSSPFACSLAIDSSSTAFVSQQIDKKEANAKETEEKKKNE